MKLLDIFKKMNPEQAESILSVDDPLLVFAGAGTGKARVLTYRTAYLVEDKKVNPEQILAITFTNKAASEMKERIEALIGDDSKSIWAMTFHSMCARTLRRHSYLLGYKNNFTIYDTDDSKSVLAKIIKEMSFQKILVPKAVLSFISNLKSQDIRPEEFLAVNPLEIKMKEVYSAYEKELHKSNALDFDDLLMKTVELFDEYPDVLEEYQEQFHYIMVDEYQDTNKIQSLLVSMLAQKYENICVVGDDDQSIYGFCGANIRNILDFEKHYPDAKIIKLQKNYRSTSNILNTANDVIKNNKKRSIKTLFTARNSGKKVLYQNFESAVSEANSVIRDIIDQSYTYQDIVILYRTNAEFRLLEEAFIKQDLPYHIVGGLNFYQRKEIKDLVSYLKIIANPADAVSVKRIINVPKRNLGETTVMKIESYAKANSLTLYSALLKIDEVPSISKKTVSSVKNFISKIEGYRYQLTKSGVLDISGDGSFSIHEYLDCILNELGYLEELERVNEPDVFTNKKENIEELISKVIEFEEAARTFKLDKLLEDIALVSGTDAKEEKNRITLMTLHSAKGLEFKKVYIVGVEEGLFPSMGSIIDKNIEEERRLCYVGITRAIDELTITSASIHMVNGRIQEMKPIRFIREMPNNFPQEY